MPPHISYNIKPELLSDQIGNIIINSYMSYSVNSLKEVYLTNRQSNIYLTTLSNGRHDGYLTMFEDLASILANDSVKSIDDEHLNQIIDFIDIYGHELGQLNIDNIMINALIRIRMRVHSHLITYLDSVRRSYTCVKMNFILIMFAICEDDVAMEDVLNTLAIIYPTATFEFDDGCITMNNEVIASEEECDNKNSLMAYLSIETIKEKLDGYFSRLNTK
jgi:hypothetical protein